MINDHSEKEKYLVDWIHEKGCRVSISETVKARTTGLIGKAEDIIQVSESPMMNGNGNSMAAFKLYEAQVIPALLFNSESWIGITDTHISDFSLSAEKKLLLFRKIMLKEERKALLNETEPQVQRAN